MSNSLNVVPNDSTVKTGVEATQRVADALADTLADTYCLIFKTHAYHWNVEGPLFYALHNLTETQYEDMFQAADVLAERIRALGKLAPMSMREILEKSAISDDASPVSAGEMCEDLVADHERLAHRMRALIEIAESENDPVTEDLAVARATFHEKAAWMLRALSAEG